MSPWISVDPAMYVVSSGALVAVIAMLDNFEPWQRLCNDRNPTEGVACFDLISPLPASIFSNEELPRLAMDIMVKDEGLL